ncbi:MAG: HEAT repeat domain-containing protein, partial [Pseudomonadota bacterium]
TIAVLGFLCYGCGKPQHAGDPSVRAVDVDAGASTSATASPADAAMPRRACFSTIVVEGRWAEAAGAKPPDEELVAFVKDRLSAQQLLEPVPSSAGENAAPVAKAKLRVRYELLVVPREGSSNGRGGPAIVRAAVLTNVEWVDRSEERAPAENLVTETVSGRKEKRPLAEIARGHLLHTLRDAVAGIAAQEKVRIGETAAVVEALISEDSGLQSMAFAVVRERRIDAAVPRLIELLGSPDPLVRDRSLGVLVSLRERRAVSAVTKLARFDDLDTMRRILDAVGAIGGEEARAYLELVATGHDHPVIRGIANDALQRMLRRTPSGDVVR